MVFPDGCGVGHWISPWRVGQGQAPLSKWFYNIFTGAAIRAVRCGSFVRKGFGLLVVSNG
jgi:hypothetical protein